MIIMIIMIPDKKKRRNKKKTKKNKKSLIEFGLGPTITQDRAILLFWGPKKIMIVICFSGKTTKQKTKNKKNQTNNKKN